MDSSERSSRRRSARAATVAPTWAVAAAGGLVSVLALGGCAVPGPRQEAAAPAQAAVPAAIAAALQEGKPEAARKLLASALRAQPQNGYLHLLNGLTYQLADGSQQSADLAQVGYDAASRFATGYYWSHYLAGLARFHQQDYAGAAEDFAWAIMDRPQAPGAFAGLAAAAYYAGDLAVARVAAERALALAPGDTGMLRNAAYVAAASGEGQRLATLMAAAGSASAAAGAMAADEPRLATLLRTAALTNGATVADGQPPTAAASQAATRSGSAAAQAAGMQQVMVEVTLLLSQDATKHSVGINLLDGLRLQFGGDNRTERRGGGGAAAAFSRVITTALSVPQITYSLNLFNSHDDFYDVVARPSLVATLGQQSEFFIGRTLSVGVSGINAGALHTIDVGTSVKLSPIEITPERTKFRVDTVRSFFVPTSSGTFTESVTTFKQTVGATAEVEFGKTLILSGLYEAVNVGWTSKVPLLGDIPVANLLFNERSKTETRDAAIVLVTPRLTSTLDTATPEFRAETLSRLLSLWKELVDPLANMDALTRRIRGSISRHFTPRSGDLRLPAASDPALARQAIGETLERLR